MYGVAGFFARGLREWDYCSGCSLSMAKLFTDFLLVFKGVHEAVIVIVKDVNGQ